MKKVVMICLLLQVGLLSWSQPGSTTSCATAILLSPGSTCTYSTQSTSGIDAWFKFIASDDAVSINLKTASFGTNAPHIHRMGLYSGSCGALTLLDDDVLGFTDVADQLNIDMTDLIIGQTYYIRVGRQDPDRPCPSSNCLVTSAGTPSTAAFEICIRDVRVYIPPDNQEADGSFLFFQNKGQLVGTDHQARTDIRAYIENTSPAMYFTDNTISYVYRRADMDTITPDSLYRFDMHFTRSDGTVANTLAFKAERVGSKLNYFNDLNSRGVTDCDGFRRIIYPEIYSNIDFQAYSKKENGSAKNYFIVHPGGNISDIAMDFTGVTQVAVSPNGKRVSLVTPAGTLQYEIDEAFRVMPNGSTNPRNVSFTLTGNTVGFNLKSSLGANQVLAVSIKLVTGPFLGNLITNRWSTYIGGGGLDQTLDVHLDDASNTVYACGMTSGGAFPVTIGPAFGGTFDGFVSKFNANRGMVWTTYWGGNMTDMINSVTYIPSSNTVAFTGLTNSSSGFPTLNPGGTAYFDGVKTQPATLFVAKVNSAGSNVWCSYFAQGQVNEVHACTHDALGDFYIAGTLSNLGAPYFPAANPGFAYTQSFQGIGDDGFISEFGPNNNLLWSTPFGGVNPGNNEQVNGMTIDNAGSLYLTGSTGSASTVDIPQPSLSPNCFSNPYPNFFPSVAPNVGTPYQQGNSGGSSDAWIAKFNSFHQIMWSTLYGGSGNEVLLSPYHNFDGVAVSPSTNDIWMVGTIDGSTLGFPIVNMAGTGVYNQPLSNGGNQEGYIVKFNSGYQLKYSTLYGGSGSDALIGVATGGTEVFISGWTDSPNFPIKNRAMSYNQGTVGGLRDACLVELNAAGSRQWSTYVGGSADDYAWGLDVDATGTNILMGGETNSTNFPVADPPGILDWTDLTANGSTDGFISNFLLFCPSCQRLKADTEDSLARSAITLYPNPSNGFVTVSTGSDEPCKVIIYNTLGEKVYEKNEVTSQVQVDASAFAPGMYLVYVISGKGSTSAKFIRTPN